jgi:Uma2 family endonuclease
MQEVWIVNLQENCLVYRQPPVNRYSLMLRFWRGEQVSPLAFPEFAVSVDEAIG